jgi:hypothetical protein
MTLNASRRASPDLLATSPIGKAAERDIELHHAERPEQKAADEAGQRELGGLGDPGDHHEGDDGKAVLDLRRQVERQKPDRERHHDAQDLPDQDGGDVLFVGRRMVNDRRRVGCGHGAASSASRRLQAAGCFFARPNLQRFRL